jgi:hypothetical protein
MFADRALTRAHLLPSKTLYDLCFRSIETTPMFGESNTANSIGPSRRGLWTGLAVGCLLLVTGAVLVSGTVDGLNFFGGRLADTTPSFPDPPKDEDARNPPRPERPDPVIPTRSPTPAPVIAPVNTKPTPVSAKPTPVSVRPTPTAAPEKPACARPGFAALLEPATEPIGTALARSLQASDLQARIVELSDVSRDSLGREDVDRIMAGDGSPVTGRIKEGTLVVAQLKIHVRPTVIDEATMTEVTGTMDLAIVRNLCGTITVQRHQDVSGRSVNETLDDGIRGLGEIFKEKIADLVRRGPGGNEQ